LGHTLQKPGVFHPPSPSIYGDRIIVVSTSVFAYKNMKITHLTQTVLFGNKENEGSQR